MTRVSNACTVFAVGAASVRVRDCDGGIHESRPELVVHDPAASAALITSGGSVGGKPTGVGSAAECRPAGKTSSGLDARVVGSACGFAGAFQPGSREGRTGAGQPKSGRLNSGRAVFKPVTLA